MSLACNKSSLITLLGGVRWLRQWSRRPMYRRLCPRCSGHRFDSDLWTFAACHSLFLSPLFPVHSSAVLSENKGTKAPRNILFSLLETWQNDNLSDNGIKPDSYVLYGADGCSRGGGVATCVSSNLSSELVVPN